MADEAAPTARWPAIVGIALAVAAVAAIGVTFLVGNKNSAVASVKRLVADGCCSMGGRSTECTKCPEMQGARIVKETVQDGCANSCQLVDLELETSAGKRVCTFMVMNENVEHGISGGCHPPER
jgi:hypothetical protein